MQVPAGLLLGGPCDGTVVHIGPLGSTLLMPHVVDMAVGQIEEATQYGRINPVGERMKMHRYNRVALDQPPSWSKYTGYFWAGEA